MTVEATDANVGGSYGISQDGYDTGNSAVDSAQIQDLTDRLSDSSIPKRKKKKPRKKKLIPNAAIFDAGMCQSEPPSIGLSKIFQDGMYPEGQDMAYNDIPLSENLMRITDAERRANERSNDCFEAWNDLRRAAEVHRQVRSYAQKVVKPGMSMTDIADVIENGTRSLVEEDGKHRGIGFPTGLSLNHCAAHYSPNPKDTIVLKAEDVMKVDFGVHVNGRIVDSAFTMTFDPVYDNLLSAVQEATETGIKAAGIDVRLADIGAEIQETMESYEIVINGKTYPIKPIRNLNGHNIKPYTIHGGKSVPIVKTEDPEYNKRMEEGETFAIETFGSTGNGKDNCSHYALIAHNRAGREYRNALSGINKFASAKHILHIIDQTFGTLPFCRRYLDRIGETTHLLGLNRLVNAGLVEAYPPLVDKVGSYTAQFEHTILLKSTSKEIVSRGNDY